MDVKLKLKALNPKVFKAYDIRGLYPQELDHNTIELIAPGFVEYLRSHNKGNLCLLGEDVRYTSPEIREMVKSKVLERGLDVLEVGVVDVPLFLFALNQSEADGGIMITASHNSIQYNGLKLYEGTRALSERTGLKDIKNIIEAGLKPYAGPRGGRRFEDFGKNYAEFVVSHASLGRKINAIFDTGGGTMGLILPKVLEKLNLKSECLFLKPDPRLSVRKPDPLSQSAQAKAREEVLKTKAEVAFIFDPDGDRLVVLDEKGEAARADAILWLLASNFAKPGDTLVADLRASRALKDEAEDKGMRLLKSRVGRSFIQELMREEDALLGGELSGHFFFKEFFYSDSALWAALKVLEILSRSEAALSELLKPFRRYFQSGDINLIAARHDLIISELSEKYKDGARNYLDGLTVEYPFWWFNLRQSNTEDLLRLVIEARSKEIFHEKKDELLAFLFGKGAKID